MRGPLVTQGRFDAALVDLDGVVTDTARVHALCWKRVFDEFLELAAAGADVVVHDLAELLP